MDAAPRSCRVAMPLLLAAACTAGTLSAAGCGLTRTDFWPSGRQVSLAEFAAPEGGGGVSAGGGQDATPEPDQAESAAAPGPAVWIGEESRAALSPARPGVPVLVDSLVGQVNGRPIFADAFLEPIEDRLMRTAEETRGQEQELRFLEIINSSLRQVVFNELMLAEAEAALTEQQRMGLLALLDRMYKEELRLGGGTVSGAEARRVSGGGLHQYLGTQKEIALVQNLLSEKVGPRVIVSWRDVEREYQRRYAEYHPPATVTLARIRLDRSAQAAQIEAVSRRLEAGEPFATIAEELGFPDGGRWETFTMGPGGIVDIGVSPDMKLALEGLAEGGTTKPFTLGGSVVWLHVAAVDRPPTRSLYDPEVQLELVRIVRVRRENAEYDRYLASLLAGGIHDDLDAMAERIYRIAFLRYGR